MKILYINTSRFDYVQDLIYSGLVKKFGIKNVIDYKWNKKYHLPYTKYPKNNGYVKGSFLKSIFRKIDFKNFDYVFIGAGKVKPLETYIEIAKEIPPTTPIIFIDGEDGEEVGYDIKVRFGAEHIYNKALEFRPFDIIFKREYLINKEYEKNVFPLPMCFNLDRLPSKLPNIYKYDFSFWAVESDPIRTKALNILENEFDCKENGTYKNQKFSKYQRKGEFYLQELKSCKITLNLRGGGWDTMRYWEVPAVGGFMLSQKPGILIPNNFEHEKDIVFIKDDLSDLVDLGKYYLKNETKREEIAKNGHNKLLEYHTDIKRVEYIFETIKKFKGKV
ncbi:glycosyltransferase [Aliarcobacter skirrowii]|uniref:glycosyltransferase n=1 Tax=Aliarcobacter skirrowii TaxID=28200 RepID=UPI0029A9A9CB|nr:glycosyltransferase [Aliarcobacter skirrowii]MDX4050974.1 glycosyltransferase [Aliarcobacter skirrowii]